LLLPEPPTLFRMKLVMDLEIKISNWRSNCQHILQREEFIIDMGRTGDTRLSLKTTRGTCTFLFTHTMMMRKFLCGPLDLSQQISFLGRRSKTFGDETTANSYYLRLDMIYVESVSF
jgi:hypothetical protein